MEAHQEKSDDTADHHGGIGIQAEPPGKGFFAFTWYLEESMDEITKSINALLAAVKGSEEYRTYKEQEEILSRNPELRKRVDQFRSSNFKLQNEATRY